VFPYRRSLLCNVQGKLLFISRIMWNIQIQRRALSTETDGFLYKNATVINAKPKHVDTDRSGTSSDVRYSPILECEVGVIFCVRCTLLQCCSTCIDAATKKSTEGGRTSFSSLNPYPANVENRVSS